MWWPITGMIDPPHDPQRIEPSRIISSPELDTGNIRFTPIAADIAALNRRALAHSDLDITAMSVFAWAHVCAKYVLTSFGSSFGEGYGPRVVARAAPDQPLTLTRSLPPGSLVAVPGTQTSAFLLLSMLLGKGSFKYIEMPFDRILDAVASGHSGITHGLLIHQSQLTFASLNLHLLIDLGAWWQSTTALPLPLGGNAIRRDLDTRYPPGTLQHVTNLMHRSLQHALTHRERSVEYAMRFAPELNRTDAERYLDMYVSPLTLNAGERGQSSMQRLLDEAASMDMCPRVRVETLCAVERT